jgi:hypothetical protein
MTDWTLMLIAMPILAGSGGHLTAIPMVDLTNCLQSSIKTLQSDMADHIAYMQAVCMPQEDAQKFIVAAHCHDPDKHHNPDRLDVSCEGVRNENVPSVVLPSQEPKGK